MKELPRYNIDESIIPALEPAFEKRNILLECYFPNQMDGKQTMSQAWKITDQSGRQAIVCTLYDKDRNENDSTRLLYMITASGKKGVELIHIANEILLSLGAVKIVP